MRNTVFIILISLLSGRVLAQPVAPQLGKPVKLADAAAFYKQYVQPHVRQESDGKNENARWDISKFLKSEQYSDGHFGKWYWYWSRHTDAQGYLVSPVQTMNEWKKLQQNKPSRQARTTSGVASWTFQGPDSSGAFVADGAGSGIGRINVVSFHPTDSNTFWIGSPGGGAWKSVNNGLSWTNMTDMLPNLSISDITFNPQNPNTIYLCTGDRDAGDYTGIGVLKSYDGGATWNTTGMTFTASVGEIANVLLVNPSDTNSLVLGTSTGIYRSFNGGTSWNFIDSGNFKQILYRPNDTNILYAAKYDSWTGFTEQTAQIFRSSNGGNSWTQVTHDTTVLRYTLAVSPAKPNMVVAVGAASSFTNYSGLEGIYISNDTGHNFTQIVIGNCGGVSGNNYLDWDTGAGCSGQGWYDLALAISPIHPNQVFLGGVNSWYSTDTGHHWTMLNQWTPGVAADPTVAVVHADKHFMTFNPLVPNRLFETSDGGVYAAYNPGGTAVWQNLTNKMGITEFYGVSVSNIANFAIAGAQDVGTKLVRPYVNEEADGGDGMHAVLDFVDSTVAYASQENGSIDILDPTAFQPDLTANHISSNIDGGTADGNGAWVTPFILEPMNHSCLIAGYQKVYKSCDQGNTFISISDSLVAYPSNLGVLAMSRTDSNTIFAAETGPSTSLFYTHNAGVTWTTLTSPDVSNHFCTGIVVDPADNGHIWATFTGYGSVQVEEWRASTGWHQINSGLPDVPVQCIQQDYLSGDLYVGTEIGVYYKDTAMTGWSAFNSGMPNVMVSELEINYATNQIWAATYGRGLWKSPKHTTTPTEVNVVPFNPEWLKVTPNPNSGAFTLDCSNIADKQIDIRITDVSGRVVWQQSGVQHTGKSVEIKTTGLRSGNYVLDVATGSSVIGRQQIVIY
jgi:photosystem II stability/assembly factor-like uncharacterized protein